uniref:Large ribosomal subunit protein bL21m n=1 Tax=Kalanchoe fedtschenkoi TaxID=63787 RepID=A0A7N0TJH2_KALFE
MAYRRSLHSLTRHGAAIISATSPSLQPLNLITQAQTLVTLCEAPDPTDPRTRRGLLDAPPRNLTSIFRPDVPQNRLFASTGGGESEDDSEDEESADEAGGDDDVSNVTLRGKGKEYTPEEKEQLAADIGYKVVGPLERTDRVFKPYELVFAVVQVGSHQFKVSNRDSIFVERLKFCEVNDKIILNKVMLLGSSTQTIVGRPILPEAAVHAVVEEHALDAKVIIFKKKRRKNYRRCKGHRQELTKLRITNIEGIEKPEYVEPVKPTLPPKPKAQKCAPTKTRLETKKPEKVTLSA